MECMMWLDRFRKKEECNEVLEEALEDVQQHEESIISLPYVEVKALRDNGLLDTGKRYRIIDYTATTKTHNTKSADHYFDLLLTPLSESMFSNKVSALPHDSYFMACDLSRWEIEYSLDNDKKRFEWADEENGKGVIYYMKDEHGNEAPYDFKNIMFKRLCVKGYEEKSRAYFGQEAGCTVYPIGGELNYDYGEFYYTFSGLRYGNQIMKPDENPDPMHSHLWICDMTVDPFIADPDIVKDGELLKDKDRDICIYNVIKPFVRFKNQLVLNNNVFISSPSLWKRDYEGYEVSFGEISNNFMDFGCYGNTICGVAVANSFGRWCKYNTIENNGEHNVFEYCCSSNRLGTDCFENRFLAGSSMNTLNYSSYNKLGESTKYNTLSHSTCNRLSMACNGNSLEDCKYNVLGMGSCNNVLTDADSNTFGCFCERNCFGENSDENIIGNCSSHNIFAKECSYNIMGQKCYCNEFDDGCTHNLLEGDNMFFRLDSESSDNVKEMHENGDHLEYLE